MASREGHDPSTLVLETRMLPITLPTHYTRDTCLVACQGNDPWSLDYQSSALPLS